MRRNINGWGYQSIKPTQEYRDNYDKVKWDNKKEPIRELEECPEVKRIMSVLYPDGNIQPSDPQNEELNTDGE